MVKVLTLNETKTCCFAHCSKVLYFGISRNNRKRSNSMKGYKINKNKSKMIWAYTNILVDPNYAFCKSHSELHPSEISFDTENITDIIYNKLPVSLKLILSNARHDLCDYYQNHDETKIDKLHWSNLDDNKMKIMCGLSSKNLNNVCIIYCFLLKCILIMF